MNYKKGFIAPLILIIVAVLAFGGGAYVYVNKSCTYELLACPSGTRTVQNSFTCSQKCVTDETSTAQTSSSQTADWKTYQNQQLGFSIKYPPQYSLGAEPSSSVLADTSWRRINDILHLGPVRLDLQRQPRIYQGKTYNIVNDLIQSGTSGIVDTDKAEYFSIGEISVAHISHPEGVGMGMVISPIDEYVLINNDLIYDFWFPSSDPYHMLVIQSINFN